MFSGHCTANNQGTLQFCICDRYESNQTRQVVIGSIFVLKPKDEIFSDEAIHAWLNGGENEA